MQDERSTTLQALVKSAGKYPEEAFLFVREGLDFAVDLIHGEEPEGYRKLAKLMVSRGMDWSDLAEKYYSHELEEALVDAIDAMGGPDALNRHISGSKLCWGLREYALERWGIMARAVLQSWNIRTTDDFGRIVFTFIEHDLMQKQPGDQLEDFHDIYSFEQAFDGQFRQKLLSSMDQIDP